MAKEISKSRVIQCEKCGIFEGLEMHHAKYHPHNVSVNDIKILCNLCHRNSKKKLSQLKTVFEDGKRFCIVSSHKFEY